MYQARALQMFLALGVAAFLASCGQSTPSASRSFAPAASAPNSVAPAATTAPYSVAVGCVFAAMEYKPDQNDPDRVFDYPDADTSSATYDPSGNLYIGVQKGPKDYWVDEYPPGSTKASRHITDGIYNPVVMIADPDGNLYVANDGPRKFIDSTVTMYKPGSTKPDITIRQSALGLAFYNHHLWLANYYANELHAYHIYAAENKAVLAWLVTSDIHGPSDLSVTGENLYVLNQPAAGADYVREYNIRGEPIFARTILGNRRLIKAMTTDVDENVYVAEWSCVICDSDVAAWNRNGELLFKNNEAKSGVQLVASPTHYFVDYNYDIVYRFQNGDDKHIDYGLKRPDKCGRPSNSQSITSLAIMQPSK